MGKDGKPQNLSLHNSLSQAQKALVLRKVSDAGHEEQPAKALKKASTKKQKAVERQKRNLNCKEAMFGVKEKTISEVLGLGEDEEMDVDQLAPDLSSGSSDDYEPEA